MPSPRGVLFPRLRLRERLNLAIFVAVPVIARILFSKGVGPTLMGDSAEYYRDAQNLGFHGYFGIGAVPDNSRPPFYPFVLGVSARLINHDPDFWVYTGLNCLFDLLSILLLARIAARIAGRAAVAGVFVVALSPIWFGVIPCALSETLSILLFLAFLDRWTREKRTGADLRWAGLFLGLLTLTRSMFLFLAPAIILFEALIGEGRHRTFAWLKSSWQFVALAYLPWAAWIARNLIVVREAMSKSDQVSLMAWETIFFPLLDFRVPGVTQKFMSDPRIVDLHSGGPEHELEVLARMKAETIAFIFQHPVRYAGILWDKTLRLWITGWWNPYPNLYSPEFFWGLYIWAFAVPVLFFGVIGVWIFWRGAKNQIASRAARAQTALCLYITAITLPLAVDPRYSIVGYVSFALFAGVGFAAFLPEPARGSGVKR